MDEGTIEIFEDEFEEEVAPDENDLQTAMQLISDIKDKALEDPGLPFEPECVKALAIIKIQNQPEFERIKTHWKGKVSWRELSNKIKAEELRILIEKVADDCGGSCGCCSSSSYINWGKSGPNLKVGPLVEDIVKDLNVRVIAGTEKDLALYDSTTGTYSIGGPATRLIIKEAIERIQSEGDIELESLNNSAISKIKSLAPVFAIEADKDFETMPFLLCVGNGVVELRIPYLIDWEPYYYMVHHTPVKYIPDKDWRELAPTFANAVEKTFDGDQDLMEYFQRYMGYCATGETKEDKILILIGVGGTGKSTLLDIVREALGGDGYVRIIKADLEGKKVAGAARDCIARARYARMLILKELEKDNNLSWGTLKELASNSSVIEARKLYGGTENFHLMGKLIIDTNFLPKADEPDRSILRRLKPLPFRHIMTEEEKDPRLFDYIVKNELEGVLAWIVEGAKKWYDSGLGNPAFIEEELGIYKTSMDTHLAVSWLEQSGYTVAHNVAQLLQEKWIHTTDLYADYRKYATEGGAEIYSIEKFSEFLEARGARKGQKERNLNGKKERSTFWFNIDRSSAIKDVQGGN